MRSKTFVTLLVLVPILAAALPAAARVNDPNVDLRFSPQDAVGAASAAIPSGLRRQPVAIDVADGRAGDDPKVIGSRTDDDDRRTDLRATAEVVPFVEGVLRRLARDWGLKVEEGAGQTLAVELLDFEVVETNQAVGATYNATVRLEGRLRRAGREVWSGSSLGDATRYGKKFSNDNCNEVLSDAMKESLAELLSQSSLHRAWDGGEGAGGGTPSAPPPKSAAAAPAGKSISPEALLAELEKLMAQDFDGATLAQYVSGKTLRRALSADDLAQWKAAGVPETVIRTAMAQPVR